MRESPTATYPVHAFARQLTGDTHRGHHPDVVDATPGAAGEPAGPGPAEAQLASLRLRVLGEADQSGDITDIAASTIADWVASRPARSAATPAPTSTSPAARDPR